MNTLHASLPALPVFTDVRFGESQKGAECIRAGSGKPALFLLGDEPLTATTFHALLASGCEVFVARLAGATPDESAIADLLTALDLPVASLLCRGTSAAKAVRFALDYPQRVSQLVLLGPELEITDRLRMLACPVLVVGGTRDSGATERIGQRLTAVIPECYDVLVYDATDAADAERPEAVAEVVSDFVARGSGFVVAKPRGAILP